MLSMNQFKPNPNLINAIFPPKTTCIAIIFILVSLYNSSISSSLSIATFNMLAPVHRSMDAKNRRESDRQEWWQPRAKQIAEYITYELGKTSDIVLLQEFWFDDGFISLFDDITSGIFDRVAERRPGFMISSDGVVMKDRRREDGMAVLVNKKRNGLKILHSDQVLTAPQRIAQLVTCQDELNRYITIANTHLSFPSHPDTNINQERQRDEMIKITQALITKNDILIQQEPSKQKQPRLEIIGGDFNSNSHSLAAQYLESTPYNFVNCASASCEQSLISGSGGRINLGVTHRTHRGEDVSVDHIFTRLVYEKQQNGEAEFDSILNNDGSFIGAHLRLGYLDNKGTRVMDCRRGNGELEGKSIISDHRPVIATLEWPDSSFNQGKINHDVLFDNDSEGLYMPLDPLEPPWGIGDIF